MDGLGTHMACAEFLELLGGGKVRPRRNAELLDILKKELDVRFGDVEAVQVLPPSVETRAPLFDSALARADFLQDQQRFVVSEYLSLASYSYSTYRYHRVVMQYLAALPKPAVVQTTTSYSPLPRHNPSSLAVKRKT